MKIEHSRITMKKTNANEKDVRKQKKMSNSLREGRLNFESGIGDVEQWVEIKL